MTAKFSIKNHRDGTATIYDDGVEIATLYPADVLTWADDNGNGSLGYAVQGRRWHGHAFGSLVTVGVASRSATDRHERSGDPEAVLRLARKKQRRWTARSARRRAQPAKKR